MLSQYIFSQLDRKKNLICASQFFVGTDHAIFDFTDVALEGKYYPNIVS